MNGFFSICRYELVGIIMYISDQKGKETAMRTISRTWNSVFLHWNPGRPSYQIDANSCWTLGWVTNYNRNMWEVFNSTYTFKTLSKVTFFSVKLCHMNTFHSYLCYDAQTEPFLNLEFLRSQIVQNVVIFNFHRIDAKLFNLFHSKTTSFVKTQVSFSETLVLKK
jgi:hypothetical protein